MERRHSMNTRSRSKSRGRGKSKCKSLKKDEDGTDGTDGTPNKSSRSQSEGPRRRSRRFQSRESQLQSLASELVKLSVSSDNEKDRIVIFTGAGLSVNSGIQPFRGKDGVWSQTLWTNATREAFRNDPLEWYNQFWLQYFSFSSTHNNNNGGDTSDNYSNTNMKHRPNEGHEALAKLCNLFPNNMSIITQNIDGLHSQTSTCWDVHNQLIECHGRIGLFKCLPDEDSEMSEDETTDDDSGDDGAGAGDENKKDEEQHVNSNDKTLPPHPRTTNNTNYKRLVKLGSLRKNQEWRQRFYSTATNNKKRPCRYEMEASIPATSIYPIATRQILCGGIPSVANTNATQHDSVIVSNAKNNSHEGHRVDNRLENNINKGNDIVKKKMSPLDSDDTPALPPHKKKIKTTIHKELDTSSIILNTNTTSFLPTTNHANPTSAIDVNTTPNTTSSTTTENDDVAIISTTSNSEREDNTNEEEEEDTESNANSNSDRDHDDDSDGRDNYRDRKKKHHSRSQTDITTKNITSCHFPITTTKNKSKTITTIQTPPKCPECSRPIAPQALLFDEAYHSHSHYQFEKMEEWISSSKLIIFIGTSFAVNITEVALDYAKDYGVKVWNFNIEGGDCLDGSGGGRLNAENVLGDVSVTLPALYDACCEQMRVNKNKDGVRN